MKVFPIGTSRLHEPLEHWPAAQWVAPGMGYFHALTQVLDLIELLNGRLELPPGLGRYFFRKDQTASNPFDEGLWALPPDGSLARLGRLFDSADTLLIEISSTRIYPWQGIHLQGNPNFHRQVPYAEVWKEGYYRRHEPAMEVQVSEDGGRIPAQLGRLVSFLRDTGRQAIIVGHLVDPARPNPQRRSHNALLASAIEAQDEPRLRFHDPSHHVARHGFRVLEDGTLDIHHLPLAALEPLSTEWLAMAMGQDVA